MCWNLHMQCNCFVFVIAMKFPGSKFVQLHEVPRAGPFTIATYIACGIAGILVHGEGFFVLVRPASHPGPLMQPGYIMITSDHEGGGTDMGTGCVYAQNHQACWALAHNESTCALQCRANTATRP